MPRKSRASLAPPAPPNVVRMAGELHEWREAVLRKKHGLTHRDALIAMAHVHRVTLLANGVPRMHYASNLDLARLSGLGESESGKRAVRVANKKLVDLGLIERLPGPTGFSSMYTYLLVLPASVSRHAA